MRLLERGDSGELCFTKDLVGDDKIPSYAILSHTWSTEEVTFKDLVDGTWTGKAGYKKISFCAEQARRDGLRHFWVDTCCIDKSNNSELQEAINSMFRWYRDAARCYVYLSDVSIPNLSQNSDQPELAWEPIFQASRWFTRGWTLQELLAPTSVEFFTLESKRLGDKRSLEQQIHKITGIPIPALRGTPLSQFGDNERFAWARTRKTTRKEDWAYCLLGIFGVFMPLIYGEGKEHAIYRLRKEIDTAKRSEWLRKLYACTYRDCKDRNPTRVKGTCEWFTSHLLFQSWQQSNVASLLWVSADPGCGKSVLAKYLADEVLPSTNARTTCYFFFKDDFEDQRSSTTALCCILRQIFIQHHASFSDQILEQFEQGGEKLLTSFRDLWDILFSAATSYKGHEIICILDALDECNELGRNQLVDAVSKLYSGTTSNVPALKFLLTSRPYLNIKRRFQHLEYKLPTIHLKGEGDEEISKISCEINMVIRSRVADFSRTHELCKEEQSVLEDELTRIPSRTYLWVHLVFNEIQNGILLTPDNIRSEVRNIPQSVDEAYNRILSKSRDINLARKLLHIVVAAARPLTVQEMALALAIGPNHRSFGDLELVPETRFRHEVRELCGLFVVVVDSKIYFLHQTAREFLVPQILPAALPSPSSCRTALDWKSSLRPKESNRILAEICILRLSLSDFGLRSLQGSRKTEQYIDIRTFLGYAAQFWADHFRNSEGDNRHWAIKKAVSFCNPHLPASLAWFEIYQTLTRTALKEYTPLSVASYLGLSTVVQQLLEAGANANEIYGSETPLLIASGKGHDAVVKRLLEAGADTNASGIYSRSPLHSASLNGHGAVVQRLLDAGANANASDDDDETPLHLASKNGHDVVVQRLLEAGADAGANYGGCNTSLHLASENGHGAMVQRLLEAGADANASDYYDETPLHLASRNGHDAMVQRLLEGGADANASNSSNETPLHLASRKGYDAVVQRLLEGGADANAKGFDGKTPLQLASENGCVSVVQRLFGGRRY